MVSAPYSHAEYTVPTAVLDAVEATVNAEFLERLADYTLRKISQRSWRGVWSGNISGGVQAEDIVASSLEAVLIGNPRKGGRQWDREKQPDLMRFLFDVIDSKISHLLERHENLFERKPTPAEDETASDFIDRKRDHRTLPEEAARPDEDEERANEQLFFALLEEVKDDPLLPGILGCNLDGIFRRAELADKLGVDPGAITQANKRLDRVLPKFREKYKHMNPFKGL